MSSSPTILGRARELAGVLIKDSARYRRAFGKQREANGDPAWVRVRNRCEHLDVNPDGPGVKCDWRWTSRLHACEVIPGWGRALQRRAFEDHPIHFADSAVSSSGPKLSILFAHRGRERLPQLRQVLRSVLAQRGVQVECIVVDFTEVPLAAELPHGVVYRHVDLRDRQPGWYKAWGYNIAARQARGDVLVFHDGDICMPQDYGGELARWLVNGEWEAASIQRLLFYVPKSTLPEVLRTDAVADQGPEIVLQNWKGGTIALRRNCFFEIGGFDEGFVDWGGEDDEFFDRCGLLKHLRYGYLPFLHLWHPAQTDRHAEDNVNETHVLPGRLAIPARRRVEELVNRRFGVVTGPDPIVRYKDRIDPAGRVRIVPEQLGVR